MIRVSIFLKETSQPIEYDKVINTYQKGDLFCVYVDGERVHKYPIANIWRIHEDYGKHSRDEV